MMHSFNSPSNSYHIHECFYLDDRRYSYYGLFSVLYGKKNSNIYMHVYIYMMQLIVTGREQHVHNKKKSPV